MKRFLPVLVSLLFVSSLFGQQLTPPCGFDEVYNRQLKNDPTFSFNEEEVNKQIQNFIEKEKKNGTHKAGTLVTIPMVFHVIHLGEAVGTGTNISDAQVESAVRGLNVNYRNNKNWGTANPSAPFSPNSVDLEVEFCLAQRDPNGQPTTGITRVKGDIFSEYMTKGCINNSSVGTVNESQIFTNQGWDKNNYYNVYVVAEINDQGGNGSGNVGYAYFPGGSLDGTVVIWKSCGYCGPGDACPFKNTSLVAPYDNGTMVHEMGHAFSLYHTFHDKANADLASQGGGTGQPIASCNNANESASQCSTSGDLCCDTQRHLGNLGSCPTAGSTINECLGTPYDVYTASNVMNYTNCGPLLFTANQRDRIQANLQTNTVRKNLAKSDACNPVYPYDLALTKISEPSGYYCTDSVAGVVTVKNQGGNAVTSFSLEILLDGVVTSTYTWTGNLASNTTTTVTVSKIFVTPGTHNYQLRIVPGSLNANSQTDGLATNNSISSSFQMITTGAQVTLTVDDYADGDNLVIKTTGASGTTIKTITLGAYNGIYTENICLPQGCYDFVFTDNDYQPLNYPPGEKKVTKFEVKDDHGYVIADGINQLNATSGAEVGVPKTETVTNKCLPYDPGYLTVDFKADKFVVTVGTAVTFTDLSTTTTGGTPAANYWKWSFGDGNGSAVKNPNYAYNTPGVYTVELIANNGIIADTANKLHYIRVIPALTGCDKLDNLISGESPVFKTTVNGVAGYYPGPNVAAPFAYSERFYVPSTSTLKSIDLFTGYVRAASPTSEISVILQNNSAGLPGTTFASQKFPLSSLSVGNYTNIPLTVPVSVADFFYITIQVNTAAGDTVVLGSSDYRPANDYSNTAFALIGGTWKPITSAFATSGPASLAISANLSVKPKASFFSSSPSICAGKSITYNSAGSTNADSFEWIFEDGSPATSTAASQSVSYANEGVKQVTLIATGGCGETDTIIKTITVSPIATVQITPVDEICGGGKGQAIAKTTGGSGNFTYSWSPGSQNAATATMLSQGTYTLTLSDAVCGTSLTETVTIKNLLQLADFTIDSTNTTCGYYNGTAIANPLGGSGTYTYKWTMPGNPSYNKTSRSIQGLAPGVYLVEVSDGSTCAPNTQDVTILPSDSIQADLVISQQQICEGDSVTLTASGGVSYAWSINNGPTISTDQVVGGRPDVSIQYKVTVTDARGCFEVIPQDVTVTLAPTASAGVTATNGVDYKNIDTIDLATGGWAFFSSAGSIGERFMWDFGDPNSITDSTSVKNPVHQYTDPGTYDVRLEVAIADCYTYDSTRVVVIGTPGSGINDAQSKGKFMVYPNPSNGLVTINNKTNLKISSIAVFDVIGKQVIQLNADSIANQIDLSNLSNGSYTIKFITNEGDFTARVNLAK